MSCLGKLRIESWIIYNLSGGTFITWSIDYVMYFQKGINDFLTYAVIYSKQTQLTFDNTFSIPLENKRKKTTILYIFLCFAPYCINVEGDLKKRGFLTPVFNLSIGNFILQLQPTFTQRTMIAFFYSWIKCILHQTKLKSWKKTFGNHWIGRIHSNFYSNKIVQ